MMGMEITVKLDEAASERVRSMTEDGARYDSIETYVADLIHRDAEHAFHELEAVKAELQKAFAAPESDAKLFDADAFRTRMRARHG